MAKRSKEPTQDQLEDELMESLDLAREIGLRIFADKLDDDTVFEICDRIEEDDPEAFEDALKRIHERAQKFFKTPTPTTDQVLGIFERAFPDE